MGKLANKLRRVLTSKPDTWYTVYLITDLRDTKSLFFQTNEDETGDLYTPIPYFIPSGEPGPPEVPFKMTSGDFVPNTMLPGHDVVGVVAKETYHNVDAMIRLVKLGRSNNPNCCQLWWAKNALTTLRNTGVVQDLKEGR